MKTLGSVIVAIVLTGCSADTGDEARAWCHDKGGYIANTGWYEWQCIINNTPVYIPSPRDKGQR